MKKIWNMFVNILLMCLKITIITFYVFIGSILLIVISSMVYGGIKEAVKMVNMME